MYDIWVRVKGGYELRVKNKRELREETIRNIRLIDLSIERECWNLALYYSALSLVYSQIFQ